MESEIILFQSEDGQTKVEVRMDGETVWLTLNQLAELFQRDKSVISRHIKNVFEAGELLSGKQRKSRKKESPLAGRTTGSATPGAVLVRQSYISNWHFATFGACL